MSEKPDGNPVILSETCFQKLLNDLSTCKTNFIAQTEEIKKVREINARLEAELKQSRESEKSHRHHLDNAREMIANLQETKTDVNKLQEEIAIKDSTIVTLQKENESLKQQNSNKMKEIQEVHENQIREMSAANERCVQQVQPEPDAQIAQFTRVIGELRTKIKDLESKLEDAMLVAVADKEEANLRNTAQVTQLHLELVEHEALINAYRKRVDVLQNKLQQQQTHVETKRRKQ